MSFSIRSTDQVTYYSTHDPALDHSKTNWTEFLRTFDPKYAPAKEGKALVAFTLKRLSRPKYLRAISYGGGGLAACDFAVSHGLKGVSGLMWGSEPFTLTLKHQGTDDECVDPECMERLMKAPVLVAELGKVILEEMSALVPLSEGG